MKRNMTRTVTLLILSALILTSCGRVAESRLNPFNWFGRGEPVEVTEAREVNPLIPQRSIFAARAPDRTYTGIAVSQVTALRVDRVPGGAVITATGVTPRLGAHDVRLTLEETTNGIQVYALRTLQDPRDGRVGPPPGRTVTAGVRVSDQDLAGIRRIRVLSASNALESRR
ncbi:hypothetical protein [Pseudaestuariivita sp.]|uniref:hypothetical protein n=1 Tax=Pseudaestuariivita sp. TaxID=2211669 RepID=UPI004059EA12